MNSWLSRGVTPVIGYTKEDEFMNVVMAKKSKDERYISRDVTFPPSLLEEALEVAREETDGNLSMLIRQLLRAHIERRSRKSA